MGPHIPTKEEVARLDINLLAMYCQRVVDSGDATSAAAEEAGQLKHEWVMLIDSKTPPLPELKTQEDIDAYVERLKQRMVNFLSRMSSKSASA